MKKRKIHKSIYKKGKIHESIYKKGNNYQQVDDGKEILN